MATYRCVVATVTPHLRCRTSAGLKSNNISSHKLYTGNTFIADEYALVDGIVWYRDSETGYWVGSTQPNSGETLLHVTPLDTNITVSKVEGTAINKAKTAEAERTVTNSNRLEETDIETSSIVDSAQQLNDVVNDSKTRAVSDTGNTNTTSSSYIKRYSIVNSKNFPVNRGTEDNPVYDYTTDVNTVSVGGVDGTDYIQEIRENLNIFSGWTKFQANNKYHTEFNRFKLEHPDVFLKNTIGYIVFTRPDLNFYDASGELLEEIGVDPRVNYIARHNPHLTQCLTHQYDGTTGHNFNPFLSNMAQSLEVMDDSVDTLETGETFTGYKFQYSKHNIRSITSGTLNIKFKETFDLGITNLFQLWVDYQSNVYKGIFLPKDEYIWFRSVDYMCNIYYFLLDQDGETLLFWSKYFGAFPVNVPKSSLSYDAGAQVQLPDMNVTFNYIYKEDLSPATLIEFNKDAGLGNDSNVTYLPTYNAKLGHSGRTWAGVPFVSSYESNNGITANSYGFKFRFRAPEDLRDSVSYGNPDSASGYNNGALPMSLWSDRELVQRVAGLQNNTMEYLDKWNWSDELYAKAANAIRNQTGTGKNSTEVVKNATGFMDHTMEYLENWTWGEELMDKLSGAMKNGIK